MRGKIKVFILIGALVFQVSCKREQKTETEGPSPPREPIPGERILNLVSPLPDSAIKVNIRGVTKNAVPVSKGSPVLIYLDRHHIQRVSFAAGVLPSAGKKPVDFRVRFKEETMLEFKLDPAKDGWKKFSVEVPAAADLQEMARDFLLEVECDLEGRGAYIGHPRVYSLLSPATSPRQSIIAFILVDAMRQDALGIYGGPGGTPEMDRLGREGVVFTRAYTSSPFTLTSLASIFTGYFPWQHKVIFSSEGGLFMPPELPTLVEKFQSWGYITAAFSGTYFLLSQNGFAKGFDHLDETCAESFFRNSADCLTDRVLDFLSRWDREALFLYIHYVDTHAPYYPPEPFRSRFTEGLEKPFFNDVGLGEIQQFSNNRPWYWFFRRPGSRDLAYLRGLYQGEVAYVDSRLGELVKAMESRAVVRLLLTADHGEAFYEHGEMDHVGDLHEPVMRVPFILRGPGVPEGLRIDQPVRTIDMMPTLLGLAGKSVPSRIPGRSLVPLLRGKKLPPAPAAAVHYLNGRPEYALVMGDWKLFAIPSRSRYRLYNLREDPGEREDLSRKNPEQLERMKKELEKLLALPGPERKPPFLKPSDRHTRSRLKALGYVK